MYLQATYMYLRLHTCDIHVPPGYIHVTYMHLQDDLRLSLNPTLIYTPVSTSTCLSSNKVMKYKNGSLEVRNCVADYQASS